MAVQFRQDLVSGDWVLITTERGKRPLPKYDNEFYQTEEECPFENPQLTGHGQPVLVYLNGKRASWDGDFKGDWTLQIIPNKFPAMRPGGPCSIEHVGPTYMCHAFGYHELLITKSHEKHFANFSSQETEEVIMAYRDRFIEISKDDCGEYVSIFHNRGKSAGGSIYHNHSQIISTPILPPEVAHSIRGAERYYTERGHKAHEAMIEWEMAEQKRVFWENDKFVAFCPYASKTPYEIRIFPKASYPYFHQIPNEDIPSLAQAFNAVMGKLFKALGDPNYNLYIHTAPIQKDPSINYEFYHWHVEIVPKIKIEAGFEMGTGLFVNHVDPDEAAQLLRETQI